MSSPGKSEELREKTFDHEWIIKNWKNVIQDEQLVNNTTTTVQCEVDDVMCATLLVGTTLYPLNTGSNRSIAFYWMLVNKHFCLETVQANVVLSTLNGEGIPTHTFEKEANAEIGKVEDFERDFFIFAYSGDISYYVNTEGSMVIKLNVTLKNVPNLSCGSKKEEFKKASTNELVKHFATLLNEDSRGDITIISKDDGKLYAHKAILRARCPVFASMFRSDFLESSTGTIKVDDISAKTMKILLMYWYTGELLPSWDDNDIVVELAYAAEKYQMPQVLKMLDDLLGCGFKASDMDIELLKMVQKLSLKNAESRILKRIIHKISNASSGSELLDLFQLASDSFDQNNLEASQIFKSFDDVLSEQDDSNASFNDFKVLVMACKLEMKNVEKKFVKRIVNTVVKFDSADQLFELVGIQNESIDKDLRRKHLLVRANPTLTLKNDT